MIVFVNAFAITDRQRQRQRQRQRETETETETETERGREITYLLSDISTYPSIATPTCTATHDTGKARRGGLGLDGRW